jgi:hypothetical protein
MAFVDQSLKKTSRAGFTQRRNDATKINVLDLSLKRCVVAASREAKILVLLPLFDDKGA